MPVSCGVPEPGAMPVRTGGLGPRYAGKHWGIIPPRNTCGAHPPAGISLLPELPGFPGGESVGEPPGKNPGNRAPGSARPGARPAGSRPGTLSI